MFLRGNYSKSLFLLLLELTLLNGTVIAMPLIDLIGIGYADAQRLTKHDAKTLPELLEEVFPHK